MVTGVGVIGIGRRHVAGSVIQAVPRRMYQCDIGVGCKYVTLFLQLVTVNPVVVAGTVGYVFTATLHDAVEVVVDDTLVDGIVQQPDFVGMCGGISAADVKSVVGRAIFAYYDFIVEVTLLSKY